MEEIPISKFKATCLAVLEDVRRTGRPVLITKRGEPIAEVVPVSGRGTGTSWLGSAAGTTRILGDIVSAAVDEEEWEVLRP